MSAATLKSSEIFSRIAASLLGGYIFVWGFIALGISIGLCLGVAYSEVQMLMLLLAFFVFLGAFLWSFVTKGLWRLWLVLAGGGVLMTGAAWLITKTLG